MYQTGTGERHVRLERDHDRTEQGPGHYTVVFLSRLLRERAWTPLTRHAGRSSG